ncbi:syntaxin [Chloropicon roscoffensis]|uniref:Syntaxin n=1 Tax=Chloropicon roscoffensis TaxID=1461544 RepID=A0AAX4P5G9_9CHLO|mmetsp:Transcript_8952/g.27131  ORF Transcript_8952/g.27131 Transcript_8952/m.27131 type:complete len:307 (-) Transcript_8952:75-995(-)
MASTKGFSRDRTSAFTTLRQREHAQRNTFEERDSSLLLGGAENGYSDQGLSGVDAVSASVAPAWVDAQEELTTDMAIIKQKMGELSRIHKTALKPTFDDSGDQDQQMIEVMTREITQLFRKAERKLKSLSQFQTTKDGARLITNVQQSIAAELQKLSQEFRKQQKGYLQRLRKQQEVVSLSPTFGGSLLDDGGDYDSGFTESQILKSRESENLVAEREKDIQSIVRSVEELATIMRDLSVLVIDQGSVVDRIDYNMEQVATHVEEGVKELVKAEKHQKSSRMMLCIMFLFCACIVMILVVMFQKLM